MSGLARSLPVGGWRSAIPRTCAHRSDGQRGDRIPYIFNPRRARDCRVETFGGLSMESAVHLNDGLKELRGGVFPGTADGADE
jgi:hypothetical protein